MYFRFEDSKITIIRYKIFNEMVDKKLINIIEEY